MHGASALQPGLGRTSKLLLKMKGPAYEQKHWMPVKDESQCWETLVLRECDPINE